MQFSGLISEDLTVLNTLWSLLTHCYIMSPAGMIVVDHVEFTGFILVVRWKNFLIILSDL